MPSAAPPVILGYVSRANGLGGAVVVHSDPSMTGIFARGLAVELRLRSGAAVRTRVTRATAVRGGVRIAFEHIGDRDGAERLIGATIVVDRTELGPLAEGEFLDSDLLGLEVRTRDGSVLGRLVEVIATGANDVYVVNGEHGEVLIPATRRAEIDVDLAGGRMTVAGEALEYGGADVPPDESPGGGADESPVSGAGDSRDGQSRDGSGGDFGQ